MLIYYQYRKQLCCLFVFINLFIIIIIIIATCDTFLRFIDKYKMKRTVFIENRDVF